MRAEQGSKKERAELALEKAAADRFIGVRSSCKSGPGVCFLPSYGLAGCCIHPLWDLQTKRTDYDVVWWSNGGLHYLHSGERYDKKADGGLPGVLGAGFQSSRLG